MLVTLTTSDGIVFQVRIDERRRIWWSDNWDAVFQLRREGRVRAVCYGPATYNHEDYFLT